MREVTFWEPEGLRANIIAPGGPFGGGGGGLPRPPPPPISGPIGGFPSPSFPGPGVPQLPAFPSDIDILDILGLLPGQDPATAIPSAPTGDLLPPGTTEADFPDPGGISEQPVSFDEPPLISEEPRDRGSCPRGTTNVGGHCIPFLGGFPGFPSTPSAPGAPTVAQGPFDPFDPFAPDLAPGGELPFVPGGIAGGGALPATDTGFIEQTVCPVCCRR